MLIPRMQSRDLGNAERTIAVYVQRQCSTLHGIFLCFSFPSFLLKGKLIRQESTVKRYFSLDRNN